jgi:hypothetical protein
MGFNLAFKGLKLLKTQSVLRSKHTVSVIQTSRLIMYREIIAVCSIENTLCGQNVELVVKLLVHIVTTVRYIR